VINVRGVILNKIKNKTMKLISHKNIKYTDNKLSYPEHRLNIQTDIDNKLNYLGELR